MKKAFSLVELSIVLVILGLLVGGILAGQSLIRAAELRSVTSEFTRYVTAISSFRDKYFSLPGDLANATKFWGAEASCPGTTASTGTTTCNGNGDNQIHWAAGTNYGFESHRSWQHLANAGLIEGTFSGVSPSGGSCNGDGSCTTAIGVNAPRAKVSNAGWSLNYLGNVDTSSIYYFAGNHGNVLFFGAQVANAWTYGSALKPEEAWNIDTKLDDGRPGMGAVTSWEPTNYPDCADSATASSAAYKLAVNALSCQLLMKTGY